MNARIRAKGVCAAALVLLGLASVVQAGVTYYVDDDGAADFSTILDAVSRAVTGDTIVLRPGRYTGTGNWDVVVEGKSITIRSVDPDNPNTVATTVIDCYDAEGLYHRAFNVAANTGVHLTLAGLTITNGSMDYHGGAVLCTDGDLTAINCTFSNNTAARHGGAVSCTRGTAVFEGCTFTNGESLDETSGGVYVGSGTASFTDCTFRSNIGKALFGLESRLTLADCLFQDNHGKDGGALRTYAGLDNTDYYLHMSRCAFIDNESTTSGGAYYGISARGTIDACTFMGNSAAVDGGAVYTRHTLMDVTDCLFLSNTAGNLGGAVTNSFGTKPEFVNCTFVGNGANAGGALAVAFDGRPVISNSILWNNAAATGPEIYLQRINNAYRAVATIQYSDVEKGLLGTHTDPGCTLAWGNGNINADPLFIDPAFNDYHLSTDSPCIDAGDPDYEPAADETDLEGQPRQYDSAVDMGAYEYQGLGPVYRFWSPVQRKHFYTISGVERNSMIKLYPNIYVYEGVAFYAYYGPSEPGLKPVYRFWSPSLVSHRWTIDEKEKEELLKQKDVWVDEGIVFYAYPSGKQPLGSLPVYRFWSETLGQEFFTISATDVDFVEDTYPKDWAYQAIAWYAFAAPHQPKQTAYTFTGGPEDLWYTLTLKAFVDGKEAQLDKPEIRLTPSSAEMEMKVDYADMVCTFNSLTVQTETTQYAGQILGKAGTQAIPFSLSLGGSFTALAQRGPFTIDPDTGVFADFVDAGQSLTAEQAAYTYAGSGALGTGKISFTRVSSALLFELQSFGVFEGLTSSAEYVDARVPLTFQWSRSGVKDLLFEATIGGQLVQIYVTDTYIGTQGVWEGQATNDVD